MLLIFFFTCRKKWFITDCQINQILEPGRVEIRIDCIKLCMNPNDARNVSRDRVVWRYILCEERSDAKIGRYLYTTWQPHFTIIDRLGYFKT